MKTKAFLLKMLTIAFFLISISLLINCEKEELPENQLNSLTLIENEITARLQDSLRQKGIGMLPGFDWCSVIPNLSGYYSANDGGHYYVRHLGTKVYWFGEHPSGIWANVFRGTLSGNTITGFFRDVPKGRIQGKGNLILSVKCFGSGFTKISGGNFGGSDWTRTTKPVNLPRPRSAGFGVRNDIDDLTGRWIGDDGGVYYILQINNDIIWFGEKAFSSGHPAWSNIAWGSNVYGGLWLSWIDVPKGSANSEGGILRGRVDGPNYITLGHNTGGFGGTRMWR